MTEMITIENKLAYLLVDPVTGFTNKSDVTIYGDVLFDDPIPSYSSVCNISVSANYPDFPEDHPRIGLEIYMNFRTLIGFMLEFGIKNLDDLENITPQKLLASYHSGKANILCLSGNNYFCFRKAGEIVLASDYGNDEREVLQPLITEMDYIKFTDENT